MLLKVTALKFITILDPYPLEGVGPVTIQQEPGEYKEYDILPEQIHRLIPLLDRAQDKGMLVYIVVDDGGTASTVLVACLNADAVGELMCIRGVKTTTGRWRVQKANCTDPIKMPARGVLIMKTTPTTGVMQLLGEVEGQFSGLDVLKPYFVGPAGDLVNPAPIPVPGNKVYVQKFGFPIAADVLYITGERWLVIRKN